MVRYLYVVSVVVATLIGTLRNWHDEVTLGVLVSLAITKHSQYNMNAFQA
jgi:hypothetical protein